jgi:hypothetical protein
VIEMGKEYKTRCGYRVRLYTTESRCIGGPIVGEYEMRPNEWVVCIWDTDGKYAPDARHLDLIEVKPVRVFERWVNVYITTAIQAGTELAKMQRHSQPKRAVSRACTSAKSTARATGASS